MKTPLMSYIFPRDTHVRRASMKQLAAYMYKHQHFSAGNATMTKTRNEEKPTVTSQLSTFTHSFSSTSSSLHHCPQTPHSPPHVFFYAFSTNSNPPANDVPFRRQHQGQAERRRLRHGRHSHGSRHRFSGNVQSGFGGGTLSLHKS